MPIKCLLFQLPIALEYQTWYQICLGTTIKYANYIIIIFININENIRNEKKTKKKWGCIYKTTPISAAINYKFLNVVPDQSLDNFVLFCYFGKQIIVFKKACMLMKPLEMKAKLAGK